MLGTIQSLPDIVALVRRRWLPILTVVLLGSVATLFVAMRQAHVYETYAVLQVELPRISAEAATGNAVSRSSQRLQLLQQELTSRQNMLRLIEKHGLFTDLPQLTQTERVQLLQRSLRFETIRAGQSSFGVEQPVSALVIAVQAGTPRQAAALANELAESVLKMTTLRQSERARETLDFYSAEEAQLGAAIAALEAEVTAFKNANVDSLPESVQSRREEILRLDESLRDLDLQRVTLAQERQALAGRGGAPRAIEQRQIAALDSQIATLDGQVQQMRARRAEAEAAINRAPMVETQLGTFARRLQQMQDQYSVINRLRAEAETSQRLDSERQTERFELLEPALPPDYPLASGRRKLMVFGVFGSLMAGLGLALGLELRNPVLRSARQLERALGLRPVIALPELSTRRSRWHGRMRRVAGLALVAAAAAAAWAIRMAGTAQMRLAEAKAAAPRRKG